VRCVFIALVESNRADASTISAALSARHFESAPPASTRETVAAKSRYENPWPMTKCSSASSASIFLKVPFSPSGAIVDTLFFMPTVARQSRACDRPDATIGSNFSIGPRGRKSGRQQVRSDARSCRSKTRSASSRAKEFSGHAPDFCPRQNAQSRAKVLGKYQKEVKTGVRGLGYVRTDSSVPWPENLNVKLP
jgi:hypothetical protein